MITEEKRHAKNSIGRISLVGLALLLQVCWLYSLFSWLNKYSALINLLCSIAALVLVLRIYGKHQNSAFKMPWIFLILTFPLLGLFLYLLFGHKDVTKRMRRRFEEIDPKLLREIEQDPAVMEALDGKDRSVANQCRYILSYSKYPVYQNTEVRFFDDAAAGFEAQLAELAKAERFIFMEYFIIDEGAAFARLKEVLADRVRHGVEVRMLYDDIGSIGSLDRSFIRRMEAIGVQCRVFNPVMPVLNFFMNNRDHRKITVIDGKIGFTGGYNLADEYFNLTHPYGQWKDTGIMLRGEAAESLTAMFLEMWNAMKETDTAYDSYFGPCQSPSAPGGFIQLYADSPLDGEPLGENVYINLIGHAKRSLYIMTPYLIISDEMNRALVLAAKRGVDVRIVTPGIPDKKLVYQITRSYYAGLALGGVRIYEYTPGFVHAKQVLCDGEAAVVGTINFDYRSLYHHFENGALLYGCPAIGEIARDFENTFAVSREVTAQYREGRKTVLRVAQCVLRLIAPLL